MLLLQLSTLLVVVAVIRCDGSYGRGSAQQTFSGGNSGFGVSASQQYSAPSGAGGGSFHGEGARSFSTGGAVFGGGSYSAPQPRDVLQSQFSGSGGGHRSQYGGNSGGSLSGGLGHGRNSISSFGRGQFDDRQQYLPPLRTVIRHPGGGIISGGASGSSQSSQNGYSRPKESSIIRGNAFGVRGGGRHSGESGLIIHTRSFSQPRVERNQNNLGGGFNQQYRPAFHGSQPHSSGFGHSNSDSFSSNSFGSQSYSSSPNSGAFGGGFDGGFSGPSSGSFSGRHQASQQYGAPSASQGYSSL